MSFVQAAITTLRNNASLRRPTSFLKKREEKLTKDKRTGTSSKKVNVNKNAYAQTKARKALMYKKDVITTIIALVSIGIIATLTFVLLS